MSRVEYASRPGSVEYPPGWGTPRGAPGSDERAAWIAAMVEARTGRSVRPLTARNAAAHDRAVETRSRTGREYPRRMAQLLARRATAV